MLEPYCHPEPLIEDAINHRCGKRLNRICKTVYCFMFVLPNPALKRICYANIKYCLTFVRVDVREIIMLVLSRHTGYPRDPLGVSYSSR